jgi:hypothetical protein
MQNILKRKKIYHHCHSRDKAKSALKIHKILPHGVKNGQKTPNFWRISGGFDQFCLADFYIRSGGFEKKSSGNAD